MERTEKEGDETPMKRKRRRRNSHENGNEGDETPVKRKGRRRNSHGTKNKETKLPDGKPETRWKKCWKKRGRRKENRKSDVEGGEGLDGMCWMEVVDPKTKSERVFYSPVLFFV